jgi:hypothetical protein
LSPTTETGNWKLETGNYIAGWKSLAVFICDCWVL